MLLKLMAVLAIVAIQELSTEAIRRIKDWIDKHDYQNKR